MHKLLEMGDPSELQLLRQRVEELEEEAEQLRGDLERERSKSVVVKRAMTTLRGTLQPLYNGLRMVFGELDAAGIASEGTVGTESQSSSAPLDESRYAPWKTKFPGKTAEMIDALVRYEAGLTRKQLAGFVKIDPGSGSMSQCIFKLNKAGLIEKNGNLIRLRKL